MVSPDDSVVTLTEKGCLFTKSLVPVRQWCDSGDIVVTLTVCESLILPFRSPKTVRKLFKTGTSKLDCSPPDGADGSDKESFEALSPSSKERFLTNMCGVVSGYTKKLCTRLASKCDHLTSL